MAQRIVVDCDVHGARDETVEGTSYDLVVRRSGEAFMFLTVDLCESCAKPLADIWVELAEVGRAFDERDAAELGSAVGSPTKRKRTTSLGKAVTSPSAAHAAPTDELASPCPGDDCDYVGPNLSSLRSHVRAVHDMTLAELQGEPTPFECPDCDRAFNRPQSLAVHRSRMHGYRAEA
jgi:hypothetical protein